VLSLIPVLNSREEATLIWGVIVVGYVSWKDTSIGTSFLQILRSVLHWKLLSLWVATAVYTAVIIAGAHALGLWHTTAIKESIYWYFGSGCVLTGKALTAKQFEGYSARLARTAIRFTLLLEFLIGLYVFPLAVELVLVPLVVLLAGVSAISTTAENASAKTFSDRLLTAFGVGLLIWATVEAATDLDGLLTRNRAESFVLAPALTLAFVPFLYAIWRLSRWEQDRTRRRWLESKSTS
jgi:hypothetical protein